MLIYGDYFLFSKAKDQPSLNACGLIINKNDLSMKHILYLSKKSEFFLLLITSNSVGTKIKSKYFTIEKLLMKIQDRKLYTFIY